jgi:tRNA-splicing ligase RtcB
MINKQNLNKISEYLWEIPKNFRQDMKVPARIYASEKLLEAILTDRSLEQAINVATLPGIQKYALAMPDIHQGYGFPIGGVAATEIEKGVISPGGIGYDINCGVRVLRSEMTYSEIKPHLEELANQLQRDIPSGLGRGGKVLAKGKELDNYLVKGAVYAVQKGYGLKEDLERTEEEGCFSAAIPENVSDKAKQRGKDQLGTLGSGNHFLEIERVEQIFNKELAKELGLFIDQIVVMIHTGSRGLGHQVCTDYLRIFHSKLRDYGFRLPDPELIYVPFSSTEGQKYFSAMASAANYAWANRQVLMHLVREVFRETLKSKNLKYDLELIYDVAHNIAKVEEHEIDGKKIKVCVHRKGATRAFPPGHPEVSALYQKTGQPVLIPGNMGTASYILVGTEDAMKKTFGSVCHGAGRVMSRIRAKKSIRGSDLKIELEKKGILIRSDSMPGLAEEAPAAYKDIDEVVKVVSAEGLANKVARTVPVAVIKGT